MRVLSIRQPWAWLIIHAGKDIENREWGRKYPALQRARYLAATRDFFLIHAGKGMTRSEYEDAADFVRSGDDRIKTTIPAFEDLQRGGIVGIARLTQVVEVSTSPWFFGPIGLVLQDAASLPFKPLAGALGFFEAPPELMPMRRDGVWGWADA
jgi:hypothetical protein